MLLIRLRYAEKRNTQAEKQKDYFLAGMRGSKAQPSKYREKRDDRHI